LKEQNKYDQMLPDLVDQLRRILGFANTVADEVICKEIKVLEEIIPRMFEVMYRVAEFSSDYIKRGMWSPSGRGKC
jgi:hypothetical protein